MTGVLTRIVQSDPSFSGSTDYTFATLKKMYKQIWTLACMSIATVCVVGCERHSGTFYYLDLSKNPGVETVYLDRLLLKGLSGDTAIPLISEFRDGNTILRFEVDTTSYGAQLNIFAFDDEGHYLALTPVQDENRCFFFRPIVWGDNSMTRLTWSGCQSNDNLPQQKRFILRLKDAQSLDQTLMFQFEVRPNGTWTIYEWALL